MHVIGTELQPSVCVCVCTCTRRIQDMCLRVCALCVDLSTPAMASPWKPDSEEVRAAEAELSAGARSSYMNFGSVTAAQGQGKTGTHR